MIINISVRTIIGTKIGGGQLLPENNVTTILKMTESIIQKIWAEEFAANKWFEVEHFLNKFEKYNGYVVNGDLEFLSFYCGSHETTPFRQSYIALQFLTSLTEDRFFSKDEVISILIENLYHRFPTSRNKVAECLWQLGAKWALPDLKFILANEKHKIVRDTLQHVIHVLS